MASTFHSDHSKHELLSGDAAVVTSPSIMAGNRQRTSSATGDQHEKAESAQNGDPEKSTQRSDDSASQDAEDPYKVAWEGDHDPMDPHSFSSFRKWMIVLILSSSSVCVTCASAMYTTTYDQLQSEFHISREVATLGLSLFVVGLGIGPLFLSPLSEFYGRRIIYLGAFGMYLIWLIPCAVAHNIQTLLVSRFLDGLAGSAFLSVAGGTVGDMFRKHELSFPMAVFTASPFVGPSLGPLVGGFINQYASWRWTFYVLLIWAGVELALIAVLVPETYNSVVLKHKAIKKRKETGDQGYYAPVEKMDKSILNTVLWSCIRPFQLLVLEPMCLNLCLISALLLGILYLFFGAFPLIFMNNHNFTLSQTGLTFLGILIGLIIGVACDPIISRNYARLVRNNNGVSEPEFRLPPTVVGAVIVPFSLIGFAFTTYSFVHWVVPVIFSGIFGLGVILCFTGIFTNLVESYPLYAASSLAANSFARSALAAAFPLFGDQMFENLGYQWASFLLAGLALVLMPFPYYFYKHGKRIRGTSRFAASS